MPKLGFLFNDLYSLINQLKPLKLVDDYIYISIYNNNNNNELFIDFTKLGIIII